MREIFWEPICVRRRRNQWEAWWEGFTSADPAFSALSLRAGWLSLPLIGDRLVADKLVAQLVISHSAIAYCPRSRQPINLK